MTRRAVAELLPAALAHARQELEGRGVTASSVDARTGILLVEPAAASGAPIVLAVVPGWQTERNTFRFSVHRARHVDAPGATCLALVGGAPAGDAGAALVLRVSDWVAERSRRTTGGLSFSRSAWARGGAWTGSYRVTDRVWRPYHEAWCGVVDALGPE